MALVHWNSAERNRVPILETLQQVLPSTGSVLEIASGTGQQVVYFAEHLSSLHWQPSEADPQMLDAITSRLEKAQLTNVSPPIFFDVLDEWPVDPVEAVITANLLHISLPEALPALCQGAAGILRPGGCLFIYGPFKRHGAHVSPRNVEFDASLKRQHPAWGVRDLEKVVDVARDNGFQCRDVVDMPANNFSIIFEQAR